MTVTIYNLNELHRDMTRALFPPVPVCPTCAGTGEVQVIDANDFPFCMVTCPACQGLGAMEGRAALIGASGFGIAHALTSPDKNMTDRGAE